MPRKKTIESNFNTEIGSLECCFAHEKTAIELRKEFVCLVCGNHNNYAYDWLIWSFFWVRIAVERFSGIECFPTTSVSLKYLCDSHHRLALLPSQQSSPATRCFEFLVEKAVKNIQENNFMLTPGLIIRRNRIFSSSVFRFSDFSSPSSSSRSQTLLFQWIEAVSSNSKVIISNTFCFVTGFAFVRSSTQVACNRVKWEW